MTPRANPGSELAWTGERLVSSVSGDVALEHLHRYALALELARGKVVLDVASGEGYGANLLAQCANRVIGVDIDAESVAHANRKYAKDNLEFRLGSATELPVDSASVELLVSFETLEHLAEHERMFAEIKRVLVPGGILIMSTPEKRNYSDIPQYANPFHVRELYANEFAELIDQHFQFRCMFGQRACEGSLLIPIVDRDDPHGTFRSYLGNYAGFHRTAGLRFPIYLVAIASDVPLPELQIPTLFEGERIPSNKDLNLVERDRRIRDAETEIIFRERELATTRWAAAQRETEKDRQIEQAEGELASVAEEKRELERMVTQLSDALAHSQGERQSTEHTAANLQHALDTLEREFAKQKAEFLTVSTEFLTVSNELSKVTTSRFWRSTAWLRAFARLLLTTTRRARSAVTQTVRDLRSPGAHANSLNDGPNTHAPRSRPRSGVNASNDLDNGSRCDRGHPDPCPGMIGSTSSVHPQHSAENPRT
jgi:ubiquinone/menaquinone biosynthesis C-methylase UbiE